jgi:16S rRNA (guanine(966)-N(2))-methyltransferase RsmD
MGPMRVIAGSLRGRPIRSPRGRAVRPTLGRVREAVFDILGPVGETVEVLDLYAGTGALGIEALSRGARRALFVEQSRATVAVLRSNIEELGLAGRAEIACGDAGLVLAGLARRGRRFDLVLADPPYAPGLAPGIVERLGRGGILAPEATVVVQCAGSEPLPGRAGVLGRTTERKYGGTKVAFYRAGDGPAEEGED